MLLDCIKISISYYINIYYNILLLHRLPQRLHFAESRIGETRGEEGYLLFTMGYLLLQWHVPLYYRRERLYN